MKLNDKSSKKSIAVFANYKVGIILAFALNAHSCKKIVDVDPPATKVTAESVYSSDATATAVLTGLYSRMALINYSSSPSITNLTLWAGLSADEFNLRTGGTVSQIAYFRNTLSTSSGGTEFWNNIYPLIFTCNSAIEGLNSSNKLTPVVKQQLLGEANFLRAFYYFYLLNLYGDLPLALTTDYRINSILARSSKEIVYEQIIADLKNAQELLSESYLKADAMTPYSNSVTSERVRPNKSAATALLARVYLFSGDYKNAENQATAVLNNSSNYTLTSLNNVFLKNSMEAIWQLQPVTTGTITNTADAVTFNLSFSPAGLNTTHPVYLSSYLLNAFELNDNRKTSWIKNFTDVNGTYYYPVKYKVNPTGTNITPLEYFTVLRLAELYLIRAEARAHLNNLFDAQSDLNKIRNRAGLSDASFNDKASLLGAIWHEKQVELFAEWGHRWLDLKRTNSIDIIMEQVCAKKGGAWSTNWQLYPIPLGDIQKDPNLIQNPGY